MKRILLGLFTMFTLASVVNAQSSKGVEIKIRIKGYSDSILYLGYYYGDKELLKDSAFVNKKGWFTFRYDKPLPCGIYGVIDYKKTTRMLEFVASSQEGSFSIETDTSDMNGKMKIEGSPENTIFNSYFQFIDKRGRDHMKLTEAMKATSDKDSVKIYQEAIKKLDVEVNDYRISFIKNNPTSVIARVFKAMQDVEVPPAPMNADGTPDSTFGYRYYKQHYWDNVDFTEDCMIRSPVFHKKLERYIKQMTYQIPDSINASADVILGLAKPHPDMYRYVLSWITNTYEKSPYMCMDAVPVHMYKNYYSYEMAPWVDTATMIRIKERAKVMEPLLCNKLAPNLIMKDTSEKYVNMHKVKAKYTVLVFWEPDCSHCRKQIPELKKVYDSLKSYGMEVFAVGVEQEYDKWLQFIRENNLNWVNAIDIYNESNFRYIYDINSTPVIFLLDENKQIIAKKLTVEQVDDILKREFGIIDRNTPLPQRKEENNH